MKGRNGRRVSAAFIVSALAVVAVASTAVAAAPDWRTPVNVRVADGVALQDADFSGRNVAITWQEPGSGGPDVGIRTSTNGGNGFGMTQILENGRQSAIDICGPSRLVAVWATKDGPGDWDIVRASASIDIPGFAASMPESGPADSLDPDVACAGGRDFVSWFERTGPGDYDLRIAYSDPTMGGFGSAIDLGSDTDDGFARNLVVAGVNDAAYAAFSRSDGDLRFKRWSVGPGPAFTVTPHPTQVIGPGSTNFPVYDAVIAAAGDTVAVAWGRCNNIFTRVSEDGGLTWGPVRGAFGSGCIEDFFPSPTFIAVRGDRIALTYHAFGLFGDPSFWLIRTNDAFMGADEDDEIAGPHDQHLVGYVTAGGAVKLADAFDPGGRIRYRRQE